MSEHFGSDSEICPNESHTEELHGKDVVGGEFQQQLGQNITPSIFAKLFVNHTKKTCAIACLIPLISLVVIILSDVFEIDDPQGREYFVRNHILTRQSDGYNAAKEEFKFSINSSDSISNVTTKQSDQQGSLSISILMRGKIQGSDQLAATNNFEGSYNILNPQSLALLKKAEDAILNHKNYSEFCLVEIGNLDCENQPLKCTSPRSVLNHPLLYGIYVNDSEGKERLCGRREGHEAVEEYKFQQFLESLWSDSDSLNSRNFLDSNLTIEKNFSWASQSLIRVAMPLTGYSAIDDRQEEQLKIYEAFTENATTTMNEDLSDLHHDIFPISEQIANSSFGSIVLRDLSFSGLAILLVFLVIWVHTSSFFLACSAMIQVLLSFPITFVIYHFLFRQHFFGALQILTIFLLLGIGADDVFVFTDAWKQAAIVLGPDVDLLRRMTWTYRRSVRAMTVTSFTTAAAFIVTATSPIMPISTLGLWAGVLIILQFILVITIYPCATIMWHRFWRPRLFVRGFNRVPEEDVEREVGTPLWHRLLPVSKRPAVQHSTADYRATERFFRGPWFKFLRRLRFIIIGIGILLVCAGLWLATSLESPKETENFLPNYFPIRVALNTLQDSFPRSDTDYQLKVSFVWGIKDVNRAGTSRFKVSELGAPIFEEDFDMKKKEVQQHIFDACRYVEKEKDDLIFSLDTGIKPVRCWIRDYKVWRESTNKTGFETFATDEGLVQDLIKFSQADSKYLRYLTNQNVIFNKNQTRVLATEVSFISDKDAQLPSKLMWPVYKKWQEVIDNLNKNAPQGGDQAFVTSGFPWLYSYTQQTLLRTMITGVAIMIVVALFTLVSATLNWVIAILATLSIGGIIAMLLGLIQLYGWTLGISESVGVVVAVGFSFDGVAHVATAYVESKSRIRMDRTRDALTDLGISVLFGAVTTLVAGICLLPAIIIFFTKFAGLIISTIILSMTWSLVILPCLLMSFGPEGNFGRISPYLKNFIGVFKTKKNVEEGKSLDINHNSLENRKEENVAKA